MPSCITCDYDLQGLADTALCPECATPVARSTTDRRLRNADYHWLKRTAHSMTWLERCVAAPPCALLGGLILAMAIAVISQFSDYGMLVSAITVMAFAGLGALFFVIAYIPFSLLATPASEHFNSPIELLRPLVRITCWAPVAQFLCLVLKGNIARLSVGMPTWTADLAVSFVILFFALHDACLRRALSILAARTDDFSPRRRKRHSNPGRHAVIVGSILLILLWFPYMLAFSNRVPVSTFAPPTRALLAFAVLLATAALHSPLRDTARALMAELRAAEARPSLPDTLTLASSEPARKVLTFIHQRRDLKEELKAASPRKPTSDPIPPPPPSA